jgi:DNA-binding transcriptional LysR family regulator
MNQRRIEAFRAVMVTGSITRAAARLNVSQPAVSRLVADLEAEIDLKLFVRAGGQIIATEEARSLMEDVDFFFRGLEGVYQAAQDIKEMRKGKVRLAVMPNLSFDAVPEIISLFLKKHQDVKLTMDVLTSPNIANLVASRHFDLGFAQLSDRRPDLKILASYRLKCVCVVAHGHRLAKRESLSPEDFLDEQIVALSQHTLTAHHIRQTFLRSNVELNIKIESQPSFAACALAVKGVGVAIVDTLTAEFFGQNRLAAIPFFPEIPFDFHLFQAAHTSGNRTRKGLLVHAIGLMDDNPNMEKL